jgi:NAD(P)-dependent dehydrogenase (short-subunit alcohol dehydrogenase family)
MAKTYLITGASRGIGLELARQLAGRGEVVLGTARRPEEAAELRAIKGVTVLKLDVASEASIREMAAGLGGRGVDVLINNAGISSKTPNMEACSFAALSEVFVTNSFAPVAVTREVRACLRAAHAGLAAAGSGVKVVNITSVLGSMAMHHGGFSYGYCASKAALNMLTQKLSDELAAELPGSCTVALHPGWVQTDMGGPQAPLTVQQAAATIIKTIDGLKPEQTGAYLNTDGTGLPW